MFDGFARRRLAIGDIEINCVVGGEGPPLLLLHGWPQTLAMWAHVAPRLAGDYTVVCADLRGYGDSSKPRCLPDHSNYAFRAMAADQAGLMEALGFPRFAVIGHDRGGRTAHRLALDHADNVAALGVLDIIPTHTLFQRFDRLTALAYFHWFLLAQPEPLPERLIGADPDFFYEGRLGGLGRGDPAAFDPAQLAEYRRCWRDPAMIHGSCSDYRAAATIDLEHDEADLGRQVACPTLVMWGADGVMARHFDVAETWREKCARVAARAVPGGHFFIDHNPRETADALREFLAEAWPPV